MKGWLVASWMMLSMMLSVSSGCGYQFTVEGPGPVIGGANVQALEGPPVRMVFRTLKNQSFEPNLEFKYSRYLRQAMQGVGSAEFVDDDSSADFVMEGAILSVTLPSVAFSRTQTQESRVMVTVLVNVKDRKTGRVLWSQTASSTAEFFVGATSNTNFASELQFNRVLQDRALEQAGEMVAADLADRFLGARDVGTFEVKRQQSIPDLPQETPETPDDPESPGTHREQTSSLSVTN